VLHFQEVIEFLMNNFHGPFLLQQFPKIIPFQEKANICRLFEQESQANAGVSARQPPPGD